MLAIDGHREIGEHNGRLSSLAAPAAVLCCCFAATARPFAESSHAGLTGGQEGVILPSCQEYPQVKTSEDCTPVVVHTSQNRGNGASVQKSRLPHFFENHSVLRESEPRLLPLL